MLRSQEKQSKTPRVRILLSLLAVAVLGPVVALVYADGWANIGRDGPRLPQDEILMEISPFAALVQATQRFRVESSCETAEFLATVVLDSETDQENPFLEEFVNGISSECKLLSLAEQATGPVFQAIKDAGKLPETAYIFGLFVYDANLETSLAGYAEETIGLFSDPDSCNRLEEVARELRLPTRRCVVWSGRELL